jgi:hypothetical protein
LSDSDSQPPESQPEPTTAAARHPRKKKPHPPENVQEGLSAIGETGAVRPDDEPPASPPRPNDAEPPQRSRVMPPRPFHRPEPTRDSRPERSPPPRGDRYLDVRELSEKAWQLFAGELREEGIELIDEHDAERLTSRCFRLAEVFMRTRARRINQLQHSGTMAGEERRREEHKAKPHQPDRPAATRPQRVPDERSEISREQAEAIIEEARAAAAQEPPPPASEN